LAWLVLLGLVLLADLLARGEISQAGADRWPLFDQWRVA